MSKKLNTQSITNELSESAFFRPNTQPVKPGETLPTPLPEKPVAQEEQEKEELQDNSPSPVPERVPLPIPLIPKVKRAIRQRQPFDIYEDQYELLKK